MISYVENSTESGEKLITTDIVDRRYQNWPIKNQTS